MITGDYPGTAQSIARAIGLQNASEVISSPALGGMSDEVLADRIKTVNLFARMVPEQKLRLVQALKANDDAFEPIVKGIRTDRRIFNNLKRAPLYIFVVHIPIAGLTLVPVLLGWPLMLLPVHIAFLELIINPTCTIVFEAEREESGAMNRPRRSIHQHSSLQPRARPTKPSRQAFSDGNALYAKFSPCLGYNRITWTARVIALYSLAPEPFSFRAHSS